VTSRPPHPDLAKNLALIGGRGCGKSSIAKRLARTNRNFMLFSLDSLIRYECGSKTIPEVVAERGWRGFRECEFEVVRRAAAFQGGALIDCGGGVVVDLDELDREIYSERKVAALREHSLVVYLSRPTEYLQARIGDDPNRPELSASEGFDDIMARRDPWYRKAADHVIECGNRPKLDLAREVLGWFYERLGIDPAEVARGLR
jgi:shikimate kinase